MYAYKVNSSNFICTCINLCACLLYKRHHIQHYTNQLAKETNQYTRDLAHLPQTDLSSSELVVTFLIKCLDVYRK